MSGTAPRVVRVLVLGGKGFIGSHVVDALRDRAAVVTIGTRHPGGNPAPGAPEEVAARFERMLDPRDWAPLLAGRDVAVNCVGILRRRGSETYDRLHHRAPAALAIACRDAGIPLLHVSALGLEAPCRSGFLRSKQSGERAIRATGVAGAIIRPSLLDAPCGGYGSKWIRRVARWPWVPLPDDATGRIAALDVRDLGEAIAFLALQPPERTLGDYEFGGAEAESIRDHIARLRRATGRAPARVLTIPGWLARIGAHACDALHATPFSFGHWELLRRDNCPSRDDLRAVLGRPPRPIGAPSGPMPAPARPAAALT